MTILTEQIGQLLAAAETACDCPGECEHEEAAFNLRQLARPLAEDWLEMEKAFNRILEFHKHGANTEWCEVHEAKAVPDRYHDDRCIESTHSGDCRFKERRLPYAPDEAEAALKHNTLRKAMER